MPTHRQLVLVEGRCRLLGWLSILDSSEAATLRLDLALWRLRRYCEESRQQSRLLILQWVREAWQVLFLIHRLLGGDLINLAFISNDYGACDERLDGTFRSVHVVVIVPLTLLV